MPRPSELSTARCGECLLFGAIEGLTDGLLLVDTTDHVSYLNRRARKLLFSGSHPVPPARVEFFLREAGLADFWSTSSSETISVTTELHLTDGTLVRATISPCRSTDNRVIGKVLILRDVTKEKNIHVELTQAVARRLLKIASHDETDNPLETLTVREREVAHLLIEGLSNAEMAGRLHLSPHTVASHLKSLYGKLNVANRAQAVAYSILHGMRPAGGS